MLEKRRFVRLAINVDVKCSKDPEKSRKKGKTKNISGGGICLMTEDEDIAVKDNLNIEFSLPTGKIIKAKGRVVWIEKFQIMNKASGRKFDIGIEFTDIDDKDREYIKKFVFMTYGSEQ